jgi:hypothetical protein
VKAGGAGGAKTAAAGPSGSQRPRGRASAAKGTSYAGVRMGGGAPAAVGWMDGMTTKPAALSGRPGGNTERRSRECAVAALTGCMSRRAAESGSDGGEEPEDSPSEPDSDGDSDFEERPKKRKPQKQAPTKVCNPASCHAPSWQRQGKGRLTDHWLHMHCTAAGSGGQARGGRDQRLTATDCSICCSL